MSDDLEARSHHAITHDGETFIKLADASVTFSLYRKDIAAKDAEIARLRSALATARLVPPLNPDRWRGAINDALTNWMDSILDDETPKDALRRLIKYEVDAALDPAVSQDAADLVATARRHALEDAAKIAADFETVAYQHGNLPANDPHECAAQAAREIAASISAAAKEVKP